jgi:hypothetical protein
MYETIVISKEQARQFALDIYDQLILDIKKEQDATTQKESGLDEQCCEEGGDTE